jgi:diphthine-ammonia ligase
MFLKDLSSFTDINEIYVSKLVKVNPPVRVCTETPINFHVVLDALAYRRFDESEKHDKKLHKRHTMHIESISHWAPANIGPYSQAIRVSI